MTDRGRRRRSLAAIAVALCFAGSVAGVAHHVTASLERERRERIRSLESLAGISLALFRAEAARIEGELERMRTMLRAEGLWSAAARRGRDASSEVSEAQRVRLERSLRRGLADAPGFDGLELVVAGDAGLSLVGFVRGETLVEKRAWEGAEGEGRAKALWYGETVRRAVGSEGRQVEWGGLSPFAPDGSLRQRLAIALHAPGELVQGVLVARVDLRPWATKLVALGARSKQALELLSPEGAPLLPSVAGVAGEVVAAQSEARIGLLARAREQTPELARIELAGRQLLAQPLALGEAEGADIPLLWLVLETALPQLDRVAWLSGPWLPGLVLNGLVAALAIALLTRRERAGRATSIADSDRAAQPDAARRLEDGLARGRDEAAEVGTRIGDGQGGRAEAVETGGAHPAETEATREPRSRPFATRPWLADVRACLEREAAVRGLAVDVRCRKDIAREIESDSGWLGGLLVAIGREALASTTADRVQLEICEEADDGGARSLRFAFEAEGGALDPLAGMHPIAHALGARFEPEGTHRLALVVPASD